MSCVHVGVLEAFGGRAVFLAALDVVWKPLGSILGALEVVWVALGGSWLVLGGLLAALEASWGENKRPGGRQSRLEATFET